eukprot:TRINITY_DN22715_c0_g1_i1.p2 TRINITY_DN22715_c0_g1~~TRINITY_DN22715_c0_g1_i1.p2  ORF type:complete len:212 (+),score=100.14 TRINITY_DN22715_c0_g1_i1:80-637(+)
MGCCASSGDQLNEALLQQMTPLQLVTEADRGPRMSEGESQDERRLKYLVSQPAGAAQCLEQNAAGYTALHLAVEKNRADLVRVLISPGYASKDYVPDKELLGKKKTGGSTALHIAAVRGYEKCSELLLAHGADPTVVNDNDATPRDLTVTNFDLSQDRTGVQRERKETKDRIAKMLEGYEARYRK